MRLALARNHDIQISRIDPQREAQRVRAALGAFDPIFVGHYIFDRVEGNLEPDQRAALEDAEAFLGITGRMPWGASYELGVTNNDTFDPFNNSSSYSFLPGDRVTSSVGFAITQPLLRGLGLAENYAEVRIAKRNKSMSDEAFRAVVIDTVTEVIRAYYRLYLADQNLMIVNRNRANAAQLLQENRRRAEIGTMAPLDIYQAESEVAFRETRVIAAKRAKRAAENYFISLISEQPEAILNSSVEIQPPGEPGPLDPDVTRDYPSALAHRPDYRQVILESEIRELVIARERQQVLPELNLIASASRQGVGQTFNGSFREIGNGANGYTIGAVFSVPIFNRERLADRAISYLERNQTERRMLALEQQIMLELQNAANQVEFARQQVLSTRHARELAAKSLEAEEKKLQAGNSETFFVLRLQGDLASAELMEITALHDYRIAVADYDRACGLTLQRWNIHFN